MKKAKIKLLLTLFIILLASNVLLFVSHCNASSFSYDKLCENEVMDRRIVEGYFAYGVRDENCITDKATAISVAIKVWRETLNATELCWHTKVSYDKEYDYWYVTGMSITTYCSQCNPFYGVCGGVYHAIIASDGQIIALWVEV